MASIFFDQKMSTRYADNEGGGFHNVTNGLNGKEPTQQARGNGRIHSQVTRSDNRQMTEQEQAIAAMCNILDRTPTGARVISGEPHRRLFGSNYIEVTYNKPHGLNDGQFEGMNVTRVNDWTIRVGK